MTSLTKQYMIPDAIKNQSYEIAKQRDTIAREKGRIMGKFHNGYDDIEANWQGSIGELMVCQIYPNLALTQPHVINGVNTSNIDFCFNGFKIELKTNRFYNTYSIFFVNVNRFTKRVPDLLLCCTIDNSPRKAVYFNILGYMRTNDILKYPIKSEGISSPAYCVNVDDIEDFDSFLKENIKRDCRDFLYSMKDYKNYQGLEP